MSTPKWDRLILARNGALVYTLAILLKEFHLGMKIQTCIMTKYNVYSFYY